MLTVPGRPGPSLSLDTPAPSQVTPKDCAVAQSGPQCLAGSPFLASVPRRPSVLRADSTPLRQSPGVLSPVWWPVNRAGSLAQRGESPSAGCPNPAASWHRPEGLPVPSVHGFPPADHHTCFFLVRQVGRAPGPPVLPGDAEIATAGKGQSVPSVCKRKQKTRRALSGPSLSAGTVLPASSLCHLQPTTVSASRPGP